MRLSIQDCCNVVAWCNENIVKQCFAYDVNEKVCSFTAKGITSPASLFQLAAMHERPFCINAMLPKADLFQRWGPNHLTLFSSLRGYSNASKYFAQFATHLYPEISPEALSLVGGSMDNHDFNKTEGLAFYTGKLSRTLYRQLILHLRKTNWLDGKDFSFLAIPDFLAALINEVFARIHTFLNWPLRITDQLNNANALFVICPETDNAITRNIRGFSEQFKIGIFVSDKFTNFNLLSRIADFETTGVRRIIHTLMHEVGHALGMDHAGETITSPSPFYSLMGAYNINMWSTKPMLSFMPRELELLATMGYPLNNTVPSFYTMTGENFIEYTKAPHLFLEKLLTKLNCSFSPADTVSVCEAGEQVILGNFSSYDFSNGVGPVSFYIDQLSSIKVGHQPVKILLDSCENQTVLLKEIAENTTVKIKLLENCPKPIGITAQFADDNNTVTISEKNWTSLFKTAKPKAVEENPWLNSTQWILIIAAVGAVALLWYMYSHRNAAQCCTRKKLKPH